MTTNVNDNATTTPNTKKFSINKTMFRNVALVAAGAGAAVAVIAVLKKAPVLEVAAAVEDLKA